MDESYDSFVEIVRNEEPLMNGRFTSIEPLTDKGHFSLLFKGYDEENKKDIAIKFYDPFKKGDEYRLKAFHREARLLGEFKGKNNIVQLVNGLDSLKVSLLHSSGVSFNQEFEYLVLELAKSDIEQHIYSSKEINAVKNLLYFREMCKGVARIHNENICHRDLKPDNFLVFDKGEVKLSDLGTATTLDGSDRIHEEYNYPVGARSYWAPEQFCNIGICDINTFNADIFALGAVLFEMFTRTKLTIKVYPGLIPNLLKLNSHLLLARPLERVKIYNGVIDTIITPHRLPDIYSYNDFVPSCIKIHLDNLYKAMCDLNYLKRLKKYDFESIYRRINICLLILNNEGIQKNRRNKT